nr:fimbrillin family protein [Muribaculaceae bacterium]
MKKHIYMIMAVAAMTSCSQEEFLPGVDDAANAGALNITVTDGGYASTARAAEDGLTTVFTQGDRIGVFAVANRTIYNGIDNVSLTATEGAAGIVWTPDFNHSLVYKDGVTYYAYYPYTAQLPAAVDLTATDATAFFAPVAAAWNVADNQSDYNDYTASDLMTAKGRIEGSSLSFDMTHRMALIMINFPQSSYEFTNEPALPDYMVFSAADVRFKDREPLSLSSASYAMLVNPAISNMTFSGSYNIDDSQRNWSFTSNAAAGSANTYNIDPEKGLGKMKHHLQVGDFFLADGRLLSKDATANEVASADVVGIVYNIDPARIGDAEKQALGGNVHGSVMAVKEISQPEALFTWSEEKTDETTIGFPNICGSINAESFRIADTDFSGLHYLNLLREKRKQQYDDNMYEAFKYAAEYGSERTDHIALLAATTGWYLPTLGQWFDIVRNLCDVPLVENGILGGNDLFYWKEKGTLLDNINKKLEKIPASNKSAFLHNRWYWTASAASTQYA